MLFSEANILEEVGDGSVRLKQIPEWNQVREFLSSPVAYLLVIRSKLSKSLSKQFSTVLLFIKIVRTIKL